MVDAVGVSLALAVLVLVCLPSLAAVASEEWTEATVEFFSFDIVLTFGLWRYSSDGDGSGADDDGKIKKKDIDNSKMRAIAANRGTTLFTLVVSFLVAASYGCCALQPRRSARREGFLGVLLLCGAALSWGGAGVYAKTMDSTLDDATHVNACSWGCVLEIFAGCSAALLGTGIVARACHAPAAEDADNANDDRLKRELSPV
ncbi:hypothetical protein M885DRAFT_559951 [Pelagophyceae sp. CCMP2097]|nr:hypothetical protein M885DRAFT_559951 [Pelagophyceae sp. CCMP2097]